MDLNVDQCTGGYRFVDLSKQLRASLSAIFINNIYIRSALMN